MSFCNSQWKQHVIESAQDFILPVSLQGLVLIDRFIHPKANGCKAHYECKENERKRKGHDQQKDGYCSFKLSSSGTADCALLLETTLLSPPLRFPICICLLFCS